ncbi:MAG TPA: MFS transporter [Chthoniobacterales bacterium]
MVTARWFTALCYGGMMSLAIGLNLMPVFLTSLSLAFGGRTGLTQEQLGRLGAISFTGVVIGIFVAGSLADRWGAKVFALAGNGFIGAGLVGMAVAPTYGAFCATVFLLGGGAGILDMILSPLVASLNPQRRAASLNWLHSFYCVGAMATVLVGTIALRTGFSWRLTCLLLLGLPLALALAFAPLRFPKLVSGSEARQPMRHLLRQRWFAGALVAIFLGGATEMGMAQWLPAYAERSLGFPGWVGGTGLLFFSLSMALGRMAIGTLSTAVNPYVIMAWCCGLSVILFLLGSFLPVSAAALAACVLAGFTGSALWPTLLAVTADHYPRGGASMFAALAALGNAGGIMMPWVVGWVADASDLRWGLAVSGVAPMLLLPLVLVLKQGQRGPVP